MKRRTLVTVIVSSLFAGCLGIVDEPTAENSHSPTDENTTSTGVGPEPTPEYPTEPGIRLGEATADIHRRETITNNDVEYLDNGTVRIVFAKRGDEPLSTRTQPFEEWAEPACSSVAADAVRDHVYMQLDDTTGISVGYGRPPVIEAETLAVTVAHTTTYDRDGELQAEPMVAYEDLVAKTPREVAATIDLDGRGHTCTVPVYAVQVNSSID